MAKELLRHQGKWIRPGLFLLSAKAAGRVQRGHLEVAAALEMLHCGSLFHDDVLDNAQKRRHIVSPNVRWGPHHCVLFGDFLLASAFHLIAESGLPEVNHAVALVIESMCHGEGLQELLSADPRRLTQKDAIAVATQKTALFFSECCRLGHSVGGGEVAPAESLGEFGLQLGLAYQILDDITDIVGSEEDAGKTLRADLLRNLPTLPLALAVETHAEIREFLPVSGRQEAERVAEMMIRGEALSLALTEALRRMDQAATALDQAGNRVPERLRGLEPSFHLFLDELRGQADALSRQLK